MEPLTTLYVETWPEPDDYRLPWPLAALLMIAIVSLSWSALIWLWLLTQ